MPEMKHRKKSTRSYPKADHFLVLLAPTSSSRKLHQFLPLALWKPPATQEGLVRRRARASLAGRAPAGPNPAPRARPSLIGGGAAALRGFRGCEAGGRAYQRAGRRHGRRSSVCLRPALVSLTFTGFMAWFLFPIAVFVRLFWFGMAWFPFLGGHEGFCLGF